MPEVLKRKPRRATANARHVLDVIARAMEPRRINIAAGDFVSWNGSYTGRVLSVDGDTAVVTEPNNLAFGRAVKWRLLLTALTRMGPGWNDSNPENDRQCAADLLLTNL